MPSAIGQDQIVRARRLRRAMTDGKKKLWSELRQFRRWYGVHVRRQAPIGPYVADFLIHSPPLVIEVDGDHHQTPEGQKRDTLRDAWFAAEGYRVLRLTTGELHETFDGCVEAILDQLGLTDRTPTPKPSPQGGGEVAFIDVR